MTVDLQSLEMRRWLDRIDIEEVAAVARASSVAGEINNFILALSALVEPRDGRAGGAGGRAHRNAGHERCGPYASAESASRPSRPWFGLRTTAMSRPVSF